MSRESILSFSDRIRSVWAKRGNWIREPFISRLAISPISNRVWLRLGSIWRYLLFWIKSKLFVLSAHPQVGEKWFNFKMFQRDIELGGGLMANWDSTRTFSSHAEIHGKMLWLILSRQISFFLNLKYHEIISASL